MVGRKEEIKTLDEVMARKEAQLVAVYGRRRVGKTYLVRQYFNNRFFFYHTGEANVGLKDQLTSFRDSLKEYGLSCSILDNWRFAFAKLRELIEQGGEGKKVIFIDEMPWMDTPRSNFVSALEHFWNAWGSSRNDLVMIVCGSASSWILKNIIRNRGGLHNRITDQINLQPFNLKECEELSGQMGLDLSRHELCSLYMIFGGVAYYWSFLRKGESVSQNIDRLFFAEGGKLRGEFDSMVSSLFKRDAGHRAIFEALAGSKVGLSRTDLLKKSGFDDGGVFCKCLEALEQCGFVRRYSAYGKTSRDSLYQLVDGLSLFHLRFVKGEENPDEHFWSRTQSSPRGMAWAGLAFERVCLLHLKEIKRALQIGGVLTHVCSWRHVANDVYPKGAQVDLLLERADQVIDLCEMKYSSGRYVMKKEESEALENRVEAFKAVTNTQKTVRRVLVTASGVEENEYSRRIANVITLDDLF